MSLTISNRVVTATADSYLVTDEAVIFNSPDKIAFNVGPSLGDSKALYLKNINDGTVFVNINGLQDLGATKTPGNTLTQAKYSSVLLVAYAAGKWVLL